METQQVRMTKAESSYAGGLYKTFYLIQTFYQSLLDVFLTPSTIWVPAGAFFKRAGKTNQKEQQRHK